MRLDRKSHVLLLLGIIASIVFSTNYSYAQSLLDLSCTACITISDSKSLAIHRELNFPIILWDSNFEYAYDHNSIITINGHAKLNNPDFPITITVSDPIGNIITVDQIMPTPDSDFQLTFNTGSPLWKKDGLYVIKAQGGPASTIFKTSVELSGASPSGVECSANELDADGYCIPYEITGATVSSVSLDQQSKSIVIMLSYSDAGTLTIKPSTDIIQGIFLVLVDGEESNDVTINGNEVTIMFPEGSEQIEVIGTFVIPEFGPIAIVILGMSIIGIVFMTGRYKGLRFPKI
ncbi:MAG TPA: PEFG-CTERM domain-containing protein [Nitrosopumilaceae archaeon]